MNRGISLLFTPKIDKSGDRNRRNSGEPDSVRKGVASALRGQVTGDSQTCRERKGTHLGYSNERHDLSLGAFASIYPTIPGNSVRYSVPTSEGIAKTLCHGYFNHIILRFNSIIRSHARARSTYKLKVHQHLKLAPLFSNRAALRLPNLLFC